MAKKMAAKTKGTLRTGRPSPKVAPASATKKRGQTGVSPGIATLFGAKPLSFDPDPRNHNAFHFWDPNRRVDGKRLGDMLPFAAAWWHTMCGSGADVFGGGTRTAPFGGAPKDLDEAFSRIDIMFGMLNILGIKYYCFHDLDVIPTPNNYAEYEEYLQAVVGKLEVKQKEYGVKLLWGTAALFTLPHFGSGASTSPQREVWEASAYQVNTMLKVTARLGGIGYVLWGGREGLTTLLNTRFGQEQKQLAAFLRQVAKTAKKVAPGVTLLIEPKFSEPCIVQYDASAQVVLGFLAQNGLLADYHLNIEVNHAILASRAFGFEMEVARSAGKLGFIDFNDGDENTGWDTDRFACSTDLALDMGLSILANGGLTGINFDAKVRRDSFDPNALIQGHAGGMDLLAWGVTAAAFAKQDGQLERIIGQRYGTWDTPAGRKILSGKTTLAQAAKAARDRNRFPVLQPGNQERIERLMFCYALEASRSI